MSNPTKLTDAEKGYWDLQLQNSARYAADIWSVKQLAAERQIWEWLLFAAFWIGLAVGSRLKSDP